MYSGGYLRRDVGGNLSWWGREIASSANHKHPNRVAAFGLRRRTGDSTNDNRLRRNTKEKTVCQTSRLCLECIPRFMCVSHVSRVAHNYIHGWTNNNSAYWCLRRNRKEENLFQRPRMYLGLIYGCMYGCCS